MTRKKEPSLSIGQVIYILSNQQTIVPAKVVEEATVQTLEGKCVSWKLAIGKKEKQKVVDHKEVDGEIFITLKDIKAELTKRLNGFIKDLVEKAKERELSWFSDSDKQPTTTPVSKNVTKENVVAKTATDDQKTELREELKKLSTPTEEEMEEKPIKETEGAATITLPDGTTALVNLPDETDI